MGFEQIKDISELEKSTAPCWLWDPLLNRISWANKAGLRFWGANTIFDILERRFDPGEQVVMFVNGCYKELGSAAKQFSKDVGGYACEEDLAFVSSQYSERYKFKLTLMPLPDQRMGLLHQALTHPFQDSSQDQFGLSLSALPMPALMTNATGEIIARNKASDSFKNLESVLPELLEKCERSGMINDSLKLETNFGRRDIQYTFKKCDPDSPSSHFLLLFDDVTERKRTEKELIDKLSHNNIRNELSANMMSEDKEIGSLNSEEADKFLALRKTLADESDKENTHIKNEGAQPTPDTEYAKADLIEQVSYRDSNEGNNDQERLIELQAILDAAMDGIFTLDQHGIVHSMNAGAQAIFGRVETDVINSPFSSLFTEESAQTVRDYLNNLGEKGIASIFNDGREVYGIEKKGGSIPIFLTINPLLHTDDFNISDTGENIRYCALVRDITQWKETEIELRRAKDKAEQANLEKTSFLNSLTHEIRTPLNAILGFVDLMKMEKFGPLGDPRYKGYLTDIQTSGNHLMELTSGLLDLARMQAGKMEMNFTSVETADIIEQSVSILQEEAKRENILIRTDLDRNLPQIVADQGALRQIILNLLSNSIKFSRAGSQVIIATKLETTGEVAINVSDTGIGMNKDELKIALEPFSQAKRGKKTTNVSGTGLGLPLSKALAEANRAKFSITSDPKKGTSISITFPNSRVLTE